MNGNQLLKARYQGKRVIADLSQVLMNEAGTNLAVACYLHCQKASEAKDNRPEYVSSKVIDFAPNDLQLVERVFKEESMKAFRQRVRKMNRA